MSLLPQVGNSFQAPSSVLGQKLGTGESVCSVELFVVVVVVAWDLSYSEGFSLVVACRLSCTMACGILVP